MPKLQFGDEAYRIVGDGGEEGELVEYGMAATLDVGGKRLLAIVDADPDDPQEVLSLLPEGEWVVEGRAVAATQEDVEFAGPEAEEEQEAEVAIDDDDPDDDEDEDDEDPDEDEDTGDEEDEEEEEELHA